MRQFPAQSGAWHHRWMLKVTSCGRKCAASKSEPGSAHDRGHIMTSPGYTGISHRDMQTSAPIDTHKQRVLMHGHQGWNVRHGLCHIYMRYVYIYIYIWVAYSLCFFCCLFITVTWWYVWCFEWASGNQEEVQACLVTLWLFIISCYNLYKTTLGLLCSWFENNPHFHKYSMDFHV